MSESDLENKSQLQLSRERLSERGIPNAGLVGNESGRGWKRWYVQQVATEEEAKSFGEGVHQGLLSSGVMGGEVPVHVTTLELPYEGAYLIVLSDENEGDEFARGIVQEREKITA